MPSEIALHDTVSQLYREHHGWLMGLIRRKIGPCDHVADLVQDTFERVLRADPMELREPRAFLNTVASRLAVSYFRRQAIEKAWMEALASQPETLAPAADTQAMAIQALEAVWSVLDGLSPRTRQVFLLAQVECMPHGDIARRFGMTVNAVQKAVARALEHCYLAVYA